MSDLLPFVVVGVATGSLYGLAGVGLVLTYRTSGIFNFAQGALAAAAAYLFFTLHVSWGWPWPVSVLTVVVLFGVSAGIIFERLARRLVSAPTATIIVALVGTLLFTQGLLFRLYGVERRRFPEFLPGGTAFTVADVQVSWPLIVKVTFALVAVGLLLWFLRVNRLGLAMRGVVADPDLLALTGEEPARVRVTAWVIGCSFAAVTGILIAPTLGLDAALLGALVVQAFGAVAVGRFTSLPHTYLGGLAVGVLAGVASKYLPASGPLAGLPSVMPFLVLVVVMLVTPARSFPRGAGLPAGTAPQTRPWPASAARAGTAAGVAVLLAVPGLVGTRLPVYSTALAFVILFLSLGLLTIVSGQISLAHAALAGVGAAAFGRLTAEAGLPWLLGLLGAGLIAALAGVLLALPAMRLSGVYLALATFGFGLLMDAVVFPSSLLFGRSISGVLAAPRPRLGSALDLTGDRAFYYVILAFVLTSCVLLGALRRSRLGRYLRALAESPTALWTMGLNLHVTRMLVFAVAAFFAGVAGALYIAQVGYLNATSFNSVYSLLYLTTLVVAGAALRSGPAAFAAAAMLSVLPTYLTGLTLETQTMLAGGLAVAATIFAGRGGTRARLVTWLGEAANRADDRRRRGPIRSRLSDPLPVRLEPAE